MTVLKRKAYWNPFFCEGREVNNIIFYNDEGIMFETHRGWFGDGNNVFDSFDLVDEVKVRRATALNKMDKKENFLVSSQEAYSKVKKYDLYLYVDGNKITLDKEEIKEKKFGDTEIRRYVERTLTIYNKKIDLEETLEFIKTDFGNKVENIQNELKDLGIKLGSFELTELLKHYDLVKKD